ncbi:MAG: hypothetical protein H7276_18755 [Caulobacter sp.]|nr:hypothetical protein [Vitreoscilla sp.]
MLFNASGAVDPADVAHMRPTTRACPYPLGVDVDRSDCDDIGLVASRHDDRGWATNGGRHVDRESDLRSCGVLYRSDKDPAADAQIQAAKRVFAILEAACPRVFAPSPLASQRNIDTWQRHYLNSDAELKVSLHDGVTFSHFRSMTTQAFGSIDDVLQGKNPLRCPKIDYQTPR